MSEKNKIKLFEEKQVRTIWDEEEEKWWFSVVDIVSVLTEQPDYRSATKYWNTTKTRFLDEGSQLSTNCRQLKITLIAEYRTRLISDVVTGKLDIRDVIVPEFEAVEDITNYENPDNEEDINEMEAY